MSGDLIPYVPRDKADLELFRGSFLVPKAWKSCGPAIYISGAPGLNQSRPIALALTASTLSLCSSSGPVWSLPIAAIQDVKVENLTGISFPIDTPAGVVQMVPPTATGVSVAFKLTAMGAVGRLQIFTMTPAAAYEWVNDIHTAMYNQSTDQQGLPERQ